MEQPYMLSILSYIDNTMSAGALAALGTKASAVIIFTPKSGIFPLHHQMS